MLDVDHFKRVNDALGHVAGDDVLREVVRRTLAALRPCDVLDRFGGEESLILVPGADRAGLGAALEAVRRAVAAATVAVGAGLTVTASLGGALYGRPDGVDAGRSAGRKSTPAAD